MIRSWPGALAAFSSVVLAASLPPCAAADGEPPAAAAEPDAPESSVALDEIVVRIVRRGGEEWGAVAAPGAAATVVEARRFSGEAKSVAELVATAPGVAVRDYGGLGQVATVSIRGSSADGVVVLLDGLPLNTAFGGGVNLSSIPRHWISAIEVVRGAEGARAGAGALGGAVNIVTRPAAAGAWSAQLSSGSFDTWSAGADAALGGERWGALLALSWDRSGGRFAYDFDPLPSIANPVERRFRENNAAWSGGVLAKAFVLGAGGRWDALAQASGGEHELPGNPHALTSRDHQQDRRVLGRVRYARGLAEWLRLAAELSGREDRLATRIAAAGGEDDQRDLAGAARVSLSGDLGRHAADLTLHAGMERLHADGVGSRREREELAVSASDDVSLAGNRLRVGPAVRLERVGDFDGWSAKLGASWRPAQPLTLRASAGRTFRAPSFAELYLEQAVLAPNPLLRPETAWSADAGVALSGARGLLSLGGFAALYDDLIAYQPAAFQRFRPFNSGRSRMAGLELEAATAPFGPAGLVASGAYTLTRSRTLRGEPDVLGREVPLRPEHRLVARIAASRGAFAGHVEPQWISAQWQDARNQSRIPAALTVAAGASIRVARRPELRVHVDARNLLDRRDLQDGFGNPLPPRMILVGLRAGATPNPGAP